MALQIPCTGQELIEEVNYITDTLNIKNGAIPIEVGGTGASSAEEALDNLGANKIVSGFYTGDGGSSQFIDIGFTPSWVIVMPKNMVYNWESNIYGKIGIATSSIAATASSSQKTIVISTNGFYVYYGGSTKSDWRATNSTETFNYIAGR